MMRVSRYVKRTLLSIIMILCIATPFTSMAYDENVYGDISSLDEYVKDDWEAEWIWEENQDDNTHVAFRKHFTLSDCPNKAIAYISADSKVTLWVNGNLAVIDGNPKRGLTFDGTYYFTTDIAKYLVEGDNCITALVRYYGKDGYSHNSSGKAGFLFECDFGNEVIKSDSSFLVSRETAYVDDSESDLDMTPNYRLSESNIAYDANLSIGDFVQSDYDDSKWAPATVVGEPNDEPWNKLYLSNTPNYTYGELKSFVNSKDYDGVTFDQPGEIILELDTNRQFLPYIELSAKAGQNLTFYSDTYNDVNGLSILYSYRTKEGDQSFEGLYWINGKYLHMVIPEGVTIVKTGYRITSYPSSMGKYNCSDEDINILYKKSVDTLRVNMRDTYMDCPNRERAQWIADAVVDMRSAFYSFDSSSDLLSQRLFLNIVGWNHADGCFPTVLPNGTDYSELPCQNLAACCGLYDYYLYTGDLDTVNKCYPVMLRYVSLWECPDGMPEVRMGTWNWGDWGDCVDMPLLQTCWYYHALNQLSKLALVTGDLDGYEFMQQRAYDIESQFESTYADSRYGYITWAIPDERAQAMAIVAGLASEEQLPKCIETMNRLNNASPYMETYIEESMFMAGEGDAALLRMKERYREMIDSDYPTLWEFWDAESGTKNHAWSAGSAYLLGKYVAGVEPTKPGYESYVVKPNLYGMDSLNTTIRTPRGNIRLDVNSTEVKVNGPDYGDLVLPLDMSVNVIINGVSISDSDAEITSDGYKKYSIGKKSYTLSYDMYRLYNPCSSEHFYSSSAAERDNLINAGWIDEGVAWTAPAKSDSPVYRLYSSSTGEHHYTTDLEEKNKLVYVGWSDEGIGWYSNESGVALYRLYNPNAIGVGSHHYTSSEEERDQLISVGWRYEGIGWYGI